MSIISGSMVKPVLRAALVWALVTLAWSAFVIVLAGRLYAQERCQPVDPSTLIWTGYGFSVTLGDGQVWVNRDDVKYADVSQPRLCMPAAGMLQLLLPAAWPAHADAGPALNLAHGDYDWINKGAYRSQGGELCCGKEDCFEVPAARIKETRGGYELLDHGQTVPHAERQPSEDGKYWLYKAGDRRRCFFAPYSGS